MKEFKDIRDDQIRIIGEDGDKKPTPRHSWIIILSAIGLIAVGGLAFILIQKKEKQDEQLRVHEPALFEPHQESAPIKHQQIGSDIDSLQNGFTEILDTLINDIAIRIFIPHNAELSLHIGKLDKSDKRIIYAAQAADVRADNGGIVGAYVLKGEPIAWGLSKKGYCASIKGEVSIGVAESSPLFEKATEEEGYFFRQYPLVSNGKVTENEIKGKSIRRGICDRDGQILMVETGSRESFHDFSQALVDMGVDQAIYIVGSTAYGWAVDEKGLVHEFGEDKYYSGRQKMPENTNYIVWKRK